MLLLKPGIWKLDGHPLQQPGWQGHQPVLQADVGVAEQVVEVAEPQGLAVGFGGIHQWPADFNT